MKKQHSDQNFFLDHKMYGSALIGSRGQLVIPSQARKDLNLKTGDRIMVMGKANKFLGMLKAEDMSNMVEQILNKLTKFKQRKK